MQCHTDPPIMVGQGVNHLVAPVKQLLLKQLAEGGSMPHGDLRGCIPADLAEARYALLSPVARNEGDDPREVGRDLLLDEAVRELVAEGQCEVRGAGGNRQVRLTDRPPVPAETADQPESTHVAEVPEGQQPPPTEVCKGNDPGEMPCHEAATLFPLLEGRDYEEFKEDIRVNGQKEDITTYQGTILDGRNRYRACRELGIEPRTREWDGQGSVLDFVVSRNLHRRHLKESQRAMVAARLKPLFEQEARARMLAGKAANPMANLPQGPAREQAASLLHVSPRSVDAASKVLQQGAPELGRAVDEGRVSVSAAAELTDLPHAEQAEIAAGGKKEAAARAKRARGQKAGGGQGQRAERCRRNTGRTEGTTTASDQARSEASTGKSRSVGVPVPFELGQVLPPHVRAELRLTEKQQKEIATLEQGVKDRLDQILNKEQKQQVVAMGTPGWPEPEGGAGRHQPAPRAAMTP